MSILLLSFSLIGAAWSSTAADAAAPSLLRQFCEAGSAAGQCNIPRGMAVNPNSGDIFVADQANQRIEEFTAWGQFVKAWGWDVVATGLGDDTSEPEDQLEVCVPKDGDVCKAGTIGSGAGQFNEPQGVVIDNSGAIYIAEPFGNHRVQKFNAAGGFVLMFGGDVNKTKVEAVAPEAQQNICPVDPGDVCQAGTMGTGNGQFGAQAIGNFIAIDPGPPETIYLGDKERIQEFDTAGSYIGEIAGGPLAGETVQSLAVNPGGDLYVSFEGLPPPFTPHSKADVLKLDASSGTVLQTLKVSNPMAIAVDGENNILVADNRVNNGNGGDPANHEARILQFDPTGKQSATLFEGEFTVVAGLATSSACGIGGVDLLVSNDNPSFIRIYGPPPDIDLCPPPAVPPTISAQHALSVGMEGAVVRAKINPHFWPDTRYYVEYGTAECTDEAPCEHKALFPGALLGSDVVDADVATAGVFLGGLSPDTTYHYRFIAESIKSGAGPAFGEGIGHTGGSFHTFPLSQEPPSCPANEGFRTGASAKLPDCRAYEMVSPVDKNNGDIALNGVEQATPDGGKLTFSSVRGFAEPLGAPLLNQYLAERNSLQGWLTQSISPPRDSVPVSEEYLHSRFKAFTPDLCNGWVVQDVDVPLAEGAPAGVPNLYRRDDCEPGKGSYELLSPVFPPGFDPAIEKSQSRYWLSIGGFSDDSLHTVFEADGALTQDACASPEKEIFQIYESTVGGDLRLISVLPSGNPTCTQSAIGTGSEQSAYGTFQTNSLYHAVSSDGSRIFWTDTGNSNLVKDAGKANAGPGRLYLRLNANQPQSEVVLGKCTELAKACTVAISKADAQFWSADIQGSKAIYTVGEELFEFNLNESEPSKSKSTLLAKGVKGVMGTSEDASRVYLVSTETCSAEEENNQGDKAIKGQLNLYLYEVGEKCATGELTFVARLSTADLRAWLTAEPPSPVSALPDHRSSRVTPDGLQVAFTSAGSLTQYDNTDASSGEADGEVYLYDSTAGGGVGELACVSCTPSGARPAGQPVGPEKAPLWVAAQIPGWNSQLHADRYLSEGGGRLFFESFDALLPRDTNGAGDVYEWERAPSKAACQEIGTELYVQSAGGCLSLISSGQSPQGSTLVDASADGSDVFFATGASLLPQDPGSIDIYDARVGGGFPPLSVPRKPCEGEACQSPPSPPGEVTPASSAFQGPGNPPLDKKPRCAKGKRRLVRKGKARCVKKKRAARHREGARG